MLTQITFNEKTLLDPSVQAKPAEDFKVLLVYPNLPLMLVPPLAIGLFTRIMKNQGYQVDLFDTTGYISDEGSSPTNRVKFLQARDFDYKDDLGVEIRENLVGDFREKVLDFQPDAMIFSVVEDAFIKTLKMLACINDQDIPHILGGVFPTAAPARCMDFADVKMVGLGEGEKTIVDFTEAVRSGQPLSNLKGTWYKDPEGNIFKNEQNELTNLDKVSPDFSLINEARFYRPMGGRIFKTIPIETYRGCPYKCTFCNSPMQVTFAKESDQGHFLRRKSIDVLHQELRYITKQHNPEFFYFIDDSFLARPRKETYDFCDMYKEFSLPFWFNTRPENCDLAVLKRLKEVGCYRISFGIECGNEDYRKKVLKRYVTNEKMIERFKVIAESGIAFSVNLIVGFPGETRELIMETVELARIIKGYDTITVSMFTPYHGTELRKVAEKNEWMDPKSITVHTTSRSMLRMPRPYVNADDLDGLMRVLTLYCYFPKSDWDNIRRAEIDDEEGNKLLKHYSDIYSEKFLKQKQDDTKDMIIPSATGCKSNPKDSIRIPIPKLTPTEVEILTVHNYL